MSERASIKTSIQDYQTILNELIEEQNAELYFCDLPQKVVNNPSVHIATPNFNQVKDKDANDG